MSPIPWYGTIFQSSEGMETPSVISAEQNDESIKDDDATYWQEVAEPVFVNLLRSLGIDSQPSGIDSWAP
jgi:hypothetical protein